MTDSSLGRYKNLIRHIQNWPNYFGHKRSSHFQPTQFVTRGAELSFDVPTRELYLVFKEIFLTDFYSIRSWIGKLPSNPVVIDVGANAGYFNMLLLSKRPDANVYAYEAIESNVQLFKKNIEMNPLLGERVRLFHRAVTGKPVETITMYKEANADNSVTASVFQDFESHNLNSVTVKAISLAQILEENKIDHIDFLKLDCEGSEYPILYESSREIWKKVKSIFLEVHNLDADTRNFKFIKNFLEAEGYEISSQLARNGCYAVYAQKK